MHELPENLDDWPESPYEILDVSRESTEREVRSAYVKRIKVYKPEQFPEHFRRIREAYERISEFLKLMKSSEEGSPQILNFGNGLQFLNTDDTDDSSTPRIASHSEHDGFDTATANVEQLRSVYQKLTKRVVDGEANYIEYAQLHWMALCFPEFDVDRSALHWLTAGLKQLGFDGRLIQILQTRVELEPKLALEKSVTDLLQSLGDKNVLTTLANLRWPIAAQDDRLDLIESDVRILKKVILDEHDDAPGWIRLMTKAISILGWVVVDESRRLRELCHEEINQLGDYHFDVDHELDRMEFLAEVQSVWSAMRVSSFPIVKQTSRLIPVTWNHRYGETSTAELDRVVIGWSESILAQSGVSMTQFDEFSRMEFGEYDGTIIMQYLIDYLDDYVIQRIGYQEKDTTTNSRIRAFFDRIGPTSYANLRLQLLGFCCDEWIEPAEIIAFVADEPQYQAIVRERGMMFTLLNDLSLNLIIRAHQAFWC